MLGIIKSKEVIATGTLKMVFEVNEPFTFKPGQYCFVTLNLKYPDERGGRRQFSIVNSPNEKGIITITTRLSQSGFKKTLNEIPVGSTVELGPIAGIFTLPQSTQAPLVFIAGGIGITPFMSMLRFVEEEKLPYQIILIYSNRNQSSTAYLNELQTVYCKPALPAGRLSTVNCIFTMTDDPDWKGEKRKVDSVFIKEYFPAVNSQKYMVVGPPAMVSAVENSLMEAGVNSENITKENFSGY